MFTEILASASEFMYSELFAAAVGALVGSIASAAYLSRSEKKSSLRSAYSNVFAAAYSVMAQNTTQTRAQLIAAIESAAFLCSNESVSEMLALSNALDSRDSDVVVSCLCRLRDSAYKDVGTPARKNSRDSSNDRSE